jgi:hypothetical protein
MLPSDALLPLQGFGTTETLILGVGGLALGLYVLANSGQSVTQFRRMIESEVTPAADVSNQTGIVEVQGTARRLDDTVSAAHTGTDCLVYDYNKTLIEEDDDHGIDDHEEVDHDTRRTRTLDHDHGAVPFRVEDDSGSVPIDPTGANLEVDADEVDGHRKSHDERIKITERRIDDGETVHVWGHRNDGGEAIPDGGAYVGDGEDVNFRIGTEGRTEAVAKVGFKAVLTVVFGLVCVVGGLYVLLSYGGLL